MASKVNDVTLFSNGIGHFRRLYDITDSQKISIPFKKDHIGDVAASLQVFGKVKLDSPPSFTPSNSESTSLKIDQNNAMYSLLTSLSGSKVTVGTRADVKPYTLLGVDLREATENIPEELLVVLMNVDGVCQKSFKDILHVHFEDESVRAEINKALKANFQKIKPDSTYLDLCLSAIEDAVEAQVQYTIPVAAWKMRYAIRQQDGKFSLEGAAIIDNNTDEDWDNFRVSVVTGNPISFNTDIATVCVPNRHFVQLVDDTVLGNVSVEQGVPSMVIPCAASPAGGITRGMMKSSVANRADFGLEAMDEAAAYQTTVGPAAESPGVDATEVGDFCVFTAKEPLTILARKSAVVPMFTVPLTSCGTVLLYKEENHANRPYRAVKFKNESDYSLGKGKTVIYNEGVFSGECVLEPTKPGENRVLPHCLENGVKVTKRPSRNETKLSSVVISKGVCVTKDVSRYETEYVIENRKSEEFKVLIEHNRMLSDSEIKFEDVEVDEVEILNNGARVYLVLNPEQTLKMNVVETAVHSQTVQLWSRDRWLFDNYIHVESPIEELLENEAIQACIKTWEELAVLNSQLAELNNKQDELGNQADRVRQNLNAAGKDNAPSEWIDDLSTTEQEIRVINAKERPELNNKIRSLQKELSDQLKQVTVEWTV